MMLSSLSYWHIYDFIFPGIYRGGYAAGVALRLWHNHRFLNQDVVVRFLELVGDVHREGVFVAAGVAHQDVQVALAGTRQLAEGVEHRVQAAFVAVHAHWEPDGDRVLRYFALAEETAPGLIGHEGFGALDIFGSYHGVYLEDVGIHDGLHHGGDGNGLAFAGELRDLYFLAGYQQVVRGINDGGVIGLGGTRELLQGRQLGFRDVRGEGLDGIEVVFSAYLYVFRAEGVDEHGVSARAQGKGAAVGAHELGVHELARLRGVEVGLEVLRLLDGGHLQFDIHVDVQVQIQIQVQIEFQVQLQVGLAVVQRHTLAGNKRQNGQ